ncbi:MAG: hypothetical protein JWM63_4980 [Gammaproteobacteria bacterium]|nr:hypothetical protein [Gammaproteobacteria bacterium]
MRDSVAEHGRKAIAVVLLQPRKNGSAADDELESLGQCCGKRPIERGPAKQPSGKTVAPRKLENLSRREVTCADGYAEEGEGSRFRYCEAYSDELNQRDHAQEACGQNQVLDEEMHLAAS